MIEDIGTAPAGAVSAAIPADSKSQSWVNRTPLAWRPYLRLARLDRPIGTWLLFWPCVFGLALGAATQQRGFLGAGRDWALLALFAIGSIVMRGAGCTFNDIVDRDIDAKVARTRGRPIPSGGVSLIQAWKFLAAQCAVGLAILLCLIPFSNWIPVAVGAVSLVPIAIYPFMKRLTWWPQAWLGLTFNWGVLLGFAAQAGRISAADLVLYVGCFFWTLGYDTIYALQDMEDDALVGVKSTARLFGRHARTCVFLFYAAAIALIAVAAGFEFAGWQASLFLIPAALHFLWQVRGLEIESPPVCLRLFRANRDAGGLIALAFVAASWIPHAAGAGV